MRKCPNVRLSEASRQRQESTLGALHVRKPAESVLLFRSDSLADVVLCDGGVMLPRRARWPGRFLGYLLF